MRKKYFSVLVAGLGMLLASASPALAADITYSANTTIDLSSPDINITILATSVATSLTVGTGSFSVTVPASGTFTVTSASRDLSISGNSNATVVSLTCSSGTASLAITPSASLAETITVTPTSGACSSGGGGGGGGGSSTIPAVPATPATPAVPGETPAVPATPATPAVPGTPAPAGAHPNGSLVLDGSTIYLIRDGQRYGFRDANEYKSHGYSFGQAVAANDIDKSLPTSNGNIIKALVGTLVIDSSDNRTVYMIGTGNTKRGFVSEEVFKALGYKFGNLPKINLADYTVGPVIANSVDTHPEGALVLEGKTVWWILNGQKQGFESMAVFNTYGFPTSRIVKANSVDLALTEGSLVKFRDGTLVLDGDLYYLVSDGKKMQFSSAGDMAERGYKTSNALSASLANYESGGTVQ